MLEVGVVPFLLENLRWQCFVKLTDLSIQVFCNIGKAWWPLTSTAAGIAEST